MQILLCGDQVSPSAVFAKEIARTHYARVHTRKLAEWFFFNSSNRIPTGVDGRLAPPRNSTFTTNQLQHWWTVALKSDPLREIDLYLLTWSMYGVHMRYFRCSLHDRAYKSSILWIVAKIFQKASCRRFWKYDKQYNANLQQETINSRTFQPRTWSIIKSMS